MQPITLARNLMNTRFELVLHGENPVSLQAAGEAALAEIERIENQLSLFKPSSEIARVNALAAHELVRVSPEVFNLLDHAMRLSEETGGAFDITMAPLLRCWGLLGSSAGRMPAPAELEAARAVCGTSLVKLNPNDFTVRFARGGVMLDLGAIGKGYGVEKAVETLREAGVQSALLHGGTSTVGAIGSPPDAEAWKVAIEPPRHEPCPASIDSQLQPHPSAASVSPSPRLAGAEGPNGERAEVRCSFHHLGVRWPGQGEGPSATTKSPLAVIALHDESLSVSAVSGKCFVANGRTLGHIIDPRTGEPATGALLSAVVLPSATETDALSTALLIQGMDGHEAFSSLRPAMRSLIVSADASGKLRTAMRGIEPASVDSVR